MLTASSNCLIKTLTTADPNNSRIKGLLNWNVRQTARLEFLQILYIVTCSWFHWTSYIFWVVDLEVFGLV